LKILGLFRHAKSDWQDPRARDFDRPLNERGRKGAEIMGRHIREHGTNWKRVLSSPAIRCFQTIEIASEASGAPALKVEWDRRIYLASSATLADLLREQSDDLPSLLMVGHNPGLEDLIFDLVPDDGASPLRDVVEIKFPTASFAVLELAIERWSDLGEGCGQLAHLVRPRDLDPELGPVLTLSLIHI
jgi:phosphohistidine phosphatase